MKYKSILIFLAILIVILLGIGSYAVYDKIIKPVYFLNDMINVGNKVERSKFTLVANNVIDSAKLAYADKSITGPQPTCMTIQDLVNEGYMASLNSNYKGKVIFNSNNTVVLYLTNGSYAINGVNNVALSDSKNIKESDFISSYSCP